MVIDFVQETFRAYNHGLFGKTSTYIINNEPIFYKDIEIDNTKKNEQVTEINNIENEQVKSISRSSKKHKKYRTRMLRKRLAKVDGGFVSKNRGGHKFENGIKSLVSGDMNEEKKTCMPDSFYMAAYALKQQDNTTPLLSKDELRSKLPFKKTAPNILDAKNFVNGKNFNLKTLNECCMNPLAVLKKNFGVYILKMVAAYHDDREDDHHFMTYDGYAGILMDNYRGNKLIQREESDLKSTQTALKCFEPFFKNTKSIKLTHVFELTYNGNLV